MEHTLSTENEEKPIEFLQYLKKFIEKYERYKENVLFTFHKNSIAQIINEESLKATHNKPKDVFKITKPSSISNNLRTNKSGEDKKPRLWEMRSFSSQSVNNYFNTDKSPLKGSRPPKKQNAKGLLKLCTEKSLCTDSTKKECTFTVCKKDNFLTTKNRNWNKKNEISPINVPYKDSIPYRIEAERVEQIPRVYHNLSQVLIDIQEMDITEIKALNQDLKNDIQVTKGEEKSTDLEGRIDSIENIAQSKIHKSMSCDQEGILNILKESDYTKSEMSVLLGELTEFHKMKEAINNFADISEENPQEVTTFYEDCLKDNVPINESKGPIEETQALSAASFGSAGQEEAAENETHVRESTSTWKINTIQLQGTLFNDLLRYYPAKVEAITNIRKHIVDDLKPGFLENLEIALKDYGLPTNESALRDLLSHSEERLQIAEDYENIIHQKIGRTNKYETRETENLISMFEFEPEKPRDLLEILAPYVREFTVLQKQEQNKNQRKQQKVKSKKKEEEKIIKDEGPFNIFLKYDIRSSVWRAALKRAKRKIKLLKWTLEYKKKNGLSHDRHNEHFSEYFKNKKRELKQLRRGRATPTAINIRNVDLSDAESSSSFSSGDYYPEKALMDSMFYDYNQLQNELTVPPLKGNKMKLGKIEKLRVEKRQERSCVTNSQWEPNTEYQEKSWHQKAKNKSNKRRARIVEDYLYSSGDELIGFENPQKKKKRLILKGLAQSLISEDMSGILGKEKEMQQAKHIAQVKPELPSQEGPIEKEESIKRKYQAICLKYKMHFIYNLVMHEKILKAPYDMHFMSSVIKMGEALAPYDNDASFHTSIVKKFMKVAVRTCLGMIHIMEKENKDFDQKMSENVGAESFSGGNISSNKVPLQLLLKNATIGQERQAAWLQRFAGLTDTLRAEEELPLYFGPPPEKCTHFGPIEKNSKR